MKNFEKPLQEFSGQELFDRINQWDPKFGILAYSEGLTETLKYPSLKIRTRKEVKNEHTAMYGKNARSTRNNDD